MVGDDSIEVGEKLISSSIVSKVSFIGDRLTLEKVIKIANSSSPKKNVLF